MKSFSKRVASFAMAAAMVLSVAAVSPVDAEAATLADLAGLETTDRIYIHYAQFVTELILVL